MSRHPSGLNGWRGAFGGAGASLRACLWLAIAAPAALAGGDAAPILRLGFSSSVFVGVNENDAKASMIVLDAVDPGGQSHCGGERTAGAGWRPGDCPVGPERIGRRPDLDGGGIWRAGPAMDVKQCGGGRFARGGDGRIRAAGARGQRAEGPGGVAGAKHYFFSKTRGRPWLRSGLKLSCSKRGWRQPPSFAGMSTTRPNSRSRFCRCFFARRTRAW